MQASQAERSQPGRRKERSEISEKGEESRDVGQPGREKSAVLQQKRKGERRQASQPAGQELTGAEEG